MENSPVAVAATAMASEFAVATAVVMPAVAFAAIFVAAAFATFAAASGIHHSTIDS